MALSVELNACDIAYCTVILDPALQSERGLSFQCIGNVKQEKVAWFLGEYIRLLNDSKAESNFQMITPQNDLIQ